MSSLNGKGVGWDQLLWLFADEEPGPGGVGWMDNSVLPDFQIIHPTREALWRENVFGDLLTWINEDLAHATHLAMWGSADDAHLGAAGARRQGIEGRLDHCRERRNAHAFPQGPRLCSVTLLLTAHHGSLMRR